MKEKRWTLGIQIAPGSIACEETDAGCSIRMPEDRLCRAMHRHAAKYGMRVVVFSADGFDIGSGQLRGWELREECWRSQAVPLPDIVFNRCFCRTAEERKRSREGMLAMSRRHRWVSLGGQLPGKLRVHEWLWNDETIRNYLPPCAPLQEPADLLRWLADYPSGLFLKPDGGMQGRGVIKLTAAGESSLQIEGRTHANRTYRMLYPVAEALEKIRHAAGRRRHLIQPYLRLMDDEGRPFDIRVLVQKDGRGRWRVTGSAMRRGTAGSVTSNLHGGGEALDTAEMLSSIAGDGRSRSMLRELHSLSLRAAHLLEQRAGRLAELGLDYGMAQNGRLWLLEANSKPGRSIFALTANHEADERSIHRPLQYARILVDRQVSCGNNFQEVHS